MKETTKNLLNEMIMGYVYGKDAENINFSMLFNIFLQNEVFPVEKFDDACMEFFKYIISMKDKFMFQTYSDRNMFLSDLHRFCLNFSKYFHISNLAIQKNFTNIVNEIAEKKDLVLDVGSGELPVSSLLLGQSRGLVESMDREFLLYQNCLDKYNVEANLQFFDNSTNIDVYDFITGNRPCSAIKPIITKCSKENKPFIIQACNCEVPRMYNDWQDYADSFLDRGSPIYFYEDYIYNVDNSSAIKNLIDKNSVKKIRFTGNKKSSRFSVSQYKDLSQNFPISNIPKPTGIVVEEYQNELV